MKRFSCSFIGRKVGAIGIRCRFSDIEVTATDATDAQLRIYDTHDHISDFKAVEVEAGAALQPSEYPAY